MKKLGERLKILRGPISQIEFASKIGEKQQTYAAYESGRCEPNIEKLKKIALRNGVTIDWLLGLSDGEPPPQAPPSITVTAADVATLIATNARLVEKLVELCHTEKKDAPATVANGGGSVTKTA